MPLKAGARLGPYEILAPLGAGGMGEVYRARDTRLGREVAIKVLPASFSGDPDRLRRFEQEARAAGMLNHPNILAIYDIGSHEGVPYVVSELLEGETLRGVLPVPRRKSLEYARQVAQGLAAAHEKGVTHRDLKPENLFVTKDGRVKILDFGLAKLSQPLGESLTDAPTAAAGTQPGAVLGTVGYMSPEQVRGQPADHRSDIFSFGVILYEMVSGKRPFLRQTSVETMTAILKEDPPEVLGIEPGLERVLRHCLEKNPEERFQSARDLAFALEALGGLTGTGTVALPPVAARAKPRLSQVLFGLVLLAVLAGAYFLGRRSGYAPPSFHQLTFRRGTIQAARFAPDGQTVIYSASWGGKLLEVFSARPESPEFRSLGLSATGLLAIANSGEMALLLGCRFPGAFGVLGTLSRVPLAGGAPREMLEDVEGADWTPDGKELVIIRRNPDTGKDQLEFPVGKVLLETTGWFDQPRVSPRGDLVAFIEHPPNWDAGAVAVADREGNKKILADGWTSVLGLAWPPDGKEIWFTATKSGLARALYAVTLAGRIRLINSVTGSLTIQDFSREGRILLLHEQSRMVMGGLVPGETHERDLSWLDWSVARDLSDDGKVVLFDESGEGAGGKVIVYLQKTDGSPAVRLGDGKARKLSPDGKWAASLVSDSQLVLLPTRAGNPLPLSRRVISKYESVDWFPDSKRILITGSEQGRGLRAYVQQIEGGEPRPITPEGVPGTLPAPDGTAILIRGPERKHFLYGVEGGSMRPVPGLDALDTPIRWSGDGRFLYVRESAAMPVRVVRLELATGRRELWKEIMPSDPAGVRNINTIALSADGRWYVYSYIRTLSDLYLASGLH